MKRLILRSMGIGRDGKPLTMCSQPKGRLLQEGALAKADIFTGLLHDVIRRINSWGEILDFCVCPFHCKRSMKS